MVNFMLYIFYHNKKIKLGPCPHKFIFWWKKTRSVYKQTTLIQCDTMRTYTREPNLAGQQGMKGFSEVTSDLYFKGLINQKHLLLPRKQKQETEHPDEVF